METQFGSKAESGVTAQAGAVVRALSILYNNSRVYSIEHPVFRKTLAEHMPSFQAALADNKELILSFLKGKVRCGTLLLDPSSAIFQALAHTFEGIGLSGFCIRRGVTAEEITKLVQILTTSATEVAQGGFQKLLDREGVKNIIEKKVTLDMDGRPKPAASPEKKSAKTSIGETSVRSSRKTFELDDTIVDLGTAFGEPSKEQAPAPGPGAPGKPRPFKTFVTDALTDLTWKKASVSQIAEQISAEFEERLTEETKELQLDKQKAVRRLENVKSIVFEKLEALDVMALLVDTDLMVLAMTSSAKDLIGNLTKIPPDSPLAHCVKAKAAYMDIVINGAALTVQTIASDSSQAGETILLLTLNTE